MTAATTTAKRTGPPPAGVPTAPPLPQDVHALLRRLRMPHTRAAAPEVLATARAQRWEPVEVLRALFTAEVAGRDRSSATRRARAAFRPENVPRLETRSILDPGADAAGPADPGMVAPQRCDTRSHGSSGRVDRRAAMAAT